MKKPEPLASGFPDIRLRRNRRDDWSRALVSETSVQPSDLILPMFVQEGTKKKTRIHKHYHAGQKDAPTQTRL